LKLPHAVLNPAFNAGSKMAAEAGNVDEEFEEGDAYDDGE
jgi:hypothetical protein